MSLPLDFSSASIFTLLTILAIGCYVQTNTGFAFALVVMGLGGTFNVLPLTTLALTISFLSLVNSTTALRGALQYVDRSLMLWIFVGLIPGAVLGIWLLETLSSSHQGQLKTLLGGCILLCGLLLASKPRPNESASSHSALAASGTVAGIMGGLFSAFGPPIAFMLYRQPVALRTVLNTLLATFWLTSVLRIGLVHGMSEVDTDVYYWVLVGTPWIVLCTYLSKRFPPPVSELRLRQMALLLLAGSGISLVYAGLGEIGAFG